MNKKLICLACTFTLLFCGFGSTRTQIVDQNNIVPVAQKNEQVERKNQLRDRKVDSKYSTLESNYSVYQEEAQNYETLKGIPYKIPAIGNYTTNEFNTAKNINNIDATNISTLKSVTTITLNGDSDSDNNTFVTADLISSSPDGEPKNYNVELNGTLDRDSWLENWFRDIDEDIYSFNIYGNANVEINLTNVPSNVDYDIELYQQLDHSTNYQPCTFPKNISGVEGCIEPYGISEKITNKSKGLTPGEYFIRVFSGDGYSETEKYKLSLSVLYINKKTESIIDLCYNKGCGAAVWTSDYNPSGINPFSKLGENVLWKSYGQTSGDINNLFHNEFCNQTHVHNGTIYLWSNDSARQVVDNINKTIMPIIEANIDEQRSIQAHWEQKTKIYNGVVSLISLTLSFVIPFTNVSFATGIVLNLTATGVTSVADYIIHSIFPEGSSTTFNMLKSELETLVFVLNVKIMANDSSIIIKIKNYYDIVEKTVPNLGTCYTANFTIKLDKNPIPCSKDEISYYSPENFVLGTVYGIRNTIDYEDAVNGKYKILPNINSSKPVNIDINEDTIIESLRKGEYHWYKFTSKISSYYYFLTEGEVDTFGQVFTGENIARENFGILQENDNGGHNKNFCINRYMKANETVYIRIRGGKLWDQIGSYSFKVIKKENNVKKHYIKPVDYANTFVNDYGQGQYFNQHKEADIITEDSTMFSTSRLRCSYIIDKYLVLSSYRENADGAYLIYDFGENVTINYIKFEISLWSDNEIITENTSTVTLEYCVDHPKLGDEVWIPIKNLLRTGMSDHVKESPATVSEYLNGLCAGKIRIYNKAVSAKGNRNKGRVVIGNMECDY